jgi:thiamine pyrophosphokinase
MTTISNKILFLRQLRRFNSIVCLNGDLPSKELLHNIKQEFKLPLIAVDGASKAMYQIGIEPHLIIGDLDSDDPTLFPHVTRILRDHQDYSDFYKTVVYLEERELLPAIILGIGGGHLDHILHNISIFSQMNSVFITDMQIGFILNTSIQLNIPINSKISILGCPQAIINSNGLKWELVNHKLDMFGNHLYVESSLSNRTATSNIKIDIVDGKALVMIYTADVIDGSDNKCNRIKSDCRS